MIDRERRTGRRQRGDQAAGASTGRRTDYRHLINPLMRGRSFSDDHVAEIHRTALRVLQELGIRVLHEGARERFRQAGATVDADSLMVRLDRGLVEQALATAPRIFTIAGASPDRDVTLGGDHVAFVGVGGPPHITDLDQGKRPGTLVDTQNFFRLCQHFDVIHLQSPSVEPQDVPVQFRHLLVTQSQLTLSDKPPFVFARGAPQTADCFTMLRLARGVDEDAFQARPYCYTVINTNSPRQLDIPMCQGIIDFAAAGQVSVITPFTLAGAMAPVTIAGALTLQHAEALAGITLSQITRPGAPVVYGSFTSNVDMKSGAPAFGTPEFVKAAFGAGQLARHIGLPWRGSAATAANAPDAQATYEFLNSAWGSILGGVNMMIHSAGWLEGGLSASLEKFILDIEMLQIFAEIFQPLSATPEDIGFEAIAEIEPGGHFFGAQHTMSRYQSAFYAPLVSDWRNFGAWTEDGAKTATQRANGIWKKTLAAFTPPALDAAVADALETYVQRRRGEGGAPPES
jgi:trimethylamine--corrinoid protein Co-methyltransferase